MSPGGEGSVFAHQAAENEQVLVDHAGESCEIVMVLGDRAQAFAQIDAARLAEAGTSLPVRASSA